MEKVNVQYFVTSYKKFHKDFRKIMDVFTPDKGVHLQMKLVFDNSRKTDVSRIVKEIKKNDRLLQISNENVYTFVFVIGAEDVWAIGEISRIRRMVSRVIIRVNDKDSDYSLMASRVYRRKMPAVFYLGSISTNKFQQIYKENKKYGIPIHADVDMLYDDNYVRMFKEWLMDRNGCRVNLFSNILTYLLLDSWGDVCEFKSCLTKNFMIDAKGDIYACCKKKDISVGNLNDMTTLDDMFSKIEFLDVLEFSIMKRDECKKKCTYYEKCQGGCPSQRMERYENCSKRIFFDVMKKIETMVIDIIEARDYREMNPSAREIILSSVATNKIFKKELLI